MSVWLAIWGFGGRISRKYYWLATLAWTIALLIVLLAIGPEVEKPVPEFPTKPPLPQNFLPLLHWLPGGWWIDKEYIKPLQADKDFRIVGFISVVVLLHPLLAMSIKRLHDLNLSGWWSVPGLASHYILRFAPLIGVGGLHSPTLLFEVFDSAVSLIWLIVVGFIRGTAGPNRYGPDPLRRRVGSIRSIPARICSIKEAEK